MCVLLLMLLGAHLVSSMLFVEDVGGLELSLAFRGVSGVAMLRQIKEYTGLTQTNGYLLDIGR